MNNSSLGEKIYLWLLASYHWYLKTPERSLTEARNAALQIKALEDEHFGGKKIDPEFGNYSESVMDYFRADLQKQLKVARMRLTEFKASRVFLNEFSPKGIEREGLKSLSPTDILEKLNFIDSIISKYNVLFEEYNNIEITDSQPPVPVKSQIVPYDRDLQLPAPQQNLTNIPNKEPNNIPRSKANSTGILPRSILNTIHRLQVELDPKSEEEVVRDFRKAQKRTIISVRFLLLLIIVPILTHQISKALVVGPIVDRVRPPEKIQVFLNDEMREDALGKLRIFEENIKFDQLIGATFLSEEETEKKLKQKAEELAEEFRAESSSALKNVFADIFSVIAFVWLLTFSKKEIAVLKDFIDNIVYGLSDSAKAFIIILFTDVFVGFHSPHGWEIILEGVSRHWGLPASRDFIFLFIATFPVILDTIFKYWIFRYLSRISPSAVATYRNMNE